MLSLLTRSARGIALVLAAAVLLAVASGVASAADDTGSGDDTGSSDLRAEEALAERFAPVMMLVAQQDKCGAGEPYQPSDVEVLLDNDSVALRGPWTGTDLVEVAPDAERLSEGLRDYALDLPPDPLDPGCDYETWAARQWGKDATPTIYAHVAREKGVTDRLALQFAFYYPFNDYNNKHESDWERIQLEFATADPAQALTMTPDRVVYAQHYGSESASWEARKLEVLDETHPVVYVSAGSHASQYSEGLFLGNNESTGFGCDTTVGPHREVRPTVRTIPSDPEAAVAAYPWIAYEGHWGEVGPRRFYTGPTGPNMKLFWKKPFTWSEGAREQSFPVPGAGAAGSRGTGFFCSAVGSGSDLFRRWVVDPGPLLLVLALVLGGLLWWLRRTTWHSTAAPVLVARSAGQVVGAAVSWNREHLGVSVRLALGCVVPLVASALLQTLAGTTSVPSALRLAVLGLALVSLVVTTGAVAHAVVDQAGSAPSTRAAYAAALRRLPPTLATLAVAGLVLVLLSGTILLLPVAVVVLVGWMLLVPVSQLEAPGVLRTLRRSWQLGRRSRRVLVPLLAVVVVVGLILGLVLAAGAFIVFTAPFTVVNAIPALVTALVWPVVSLLLVYAYASVADDRPGTRRGAGTA